MTKKHYKVYSLVVTFFLTMSVSISISLENYYLPLVLVLSAMAVMYFLRKQLKTGSVLADERDYQVAGKAARYTLFIYASLATVVMFVLMTVSGGDGGLYELSQCLAYSVCFLMLLNALLFKYLVKRDK